MPPMPGEARRWSRWLKPVAAVVILAIIAKATLHYAHQLQPYVASLRLGPLLAALLICIIYRVLNSAGWVGVLRAMHQPMPVARGMRLWLLAESARWLPGSVWGFCSRVYAARKNGVPPAIASASLPLELLLTIAAWTLVAAGGLLLSGRSIDWSHLVSPRILIIAAGGGFAVAAALAICVFAFPQSRIATKIRGLLGELATLRTLALRPALLAGVALFYTALCCLNGLAFHLVIRAITDAPVSLTALIGINACGWLIGFFAIGAPGGIGVREATSAFLLSSIIPLPAAIAASILWRLVLIVDEVLCLTVCLAPTLLHSPRETTAAPVAS